MKTLMATVVGPLLGLSWILSDAAIYAKKKKKEQFLIDHEAYYIVPRQFSSKNGSPCSQFRYHNGSFRCFVMNISELIDYRDDDTYSIKNNRLVVFLSGVHYINCSVNCTTRQKWSYKPSFNMTIIGVGDVTIACMTEFHFQFIDIQYITINNIYFKNCGGDSKTTLTLNVMRFFGNDILVSLQNVEISATNITGVRINIYKAVKWSQVHISIIDSVISTGTTGVYVYQHQQLSNKASVAYTMNVANTLFYSSCLSLESLSFIRKPKKGNDITVVNTRFVESTCSPVLSLNGANSIKVTLNDVHFRATKSQYMIYASIDCLIIKGHCYFHNNRGTTLISSYIPEALESTELLFSSASVNFFNNTILHESGTHNSVIAIEDSNIIFNVSFVNNNGTNCGGITVTNGNVLFKENVVIYFINNEGGVSGAFSFYSSSLLSFNSTLSKLLLHKNKGPAIVSSNSKLFFSRTELTIINNTAYGSDMFVIMSTFVVANGSSATFDNSTIQFLDNYGQECGGVMVTKTSIISIINNSKALFIRNLGELGGAISLSSMSILQFDHGKSDVTLTFFNNEAQKGGAIFVDDSTYTHAYRLQTSAIQHAGASTRLLFHGNVALMGGSNIYGGWIDWSATDGSITFTANVWNSLDFGEIYPEITSDPLRICMCTDQVPNCSITIINLKQLYPGETMEIYVVAIGQREGTMLSPVMANIEENNSHNHSGKIRDLQSIQIAQKTCTRLSYTIMSPNREEKLVLTPFRSSEFGLKSKANESYFGSQLLDEYPHKLGLLFKQFTIRVNLKRCPLSFSLDKTNHSCICPSLLGTLQLCCDSVMYQIIRSEQRWVGITYNHTGDSEIPGLIAHQHCPFGYCKTSVESLSMNLEHRDEQCAFNRAGILCGGCQTNYSRVVGSLKCKKCSSFMLFALILSSMVAGLLLIALLMLLNLTVSIGTINGLIFYVNIIHAQHTTFFTSDTSNSFLSTFIAWLNLDQGIESCFYDGFDSYVETWLQFCFPLYLWLLVATLMVLCHFSTYISRLCDRNLVQVLATLFLLSYTKLLKLVIYIVSFATITHPDGYTQRVWLYDGNFDFLKGKHIPLFIAALLLIMLYFIPYTLSQLSFQWVSHFRITFLVQPLKPFFDAYTGPYKKRHCYWTGLLLLVRIVLLIIFSVNENNDPSINLFCIAFFSFILLAWLYFTRWLYKNLLNNFLELIFLLNLGLTATACLFDRTSTKHIMYSAAVIYTSTGITFVVFIVIILYHAQRKLFLTRCGANIKTKLTLFLHVKKDRALDNNPFQPACKVNSPTRVTYTVVELTQPLLED